MVTRSQGFKEVDPRSSRSLFLETLEIFEDASEQEDFDYRLGSVQNSFKSTVSHSSNKLRELARNIVNDKSSNLSFSTLKNRVLMEKRSEAIIVPKEVNPREQRQGLGFKRPRFSMNPNSSQGVVNAEAALDVNDPEQFFEASEQHENVKNGIKRMLQNTFLTNQPRQTGNPDHDKRSVTKHLYRSDDSETNNNVVSCHELMDSRVSSHGFNSAEEENNEVIPAEAKVNVREQRPGLGRKRARFSIKPDSSQHVVNIEPTMDVKNLNDPEEFFKACEEKENAKKEIQRQMGGVLSESELHTMSIINRPRRPGLLDHNKRRSLYRHLYQSHGLETSSTAVPTQESTDLSIPNEEHHDSGRARDCSIASEGVKSPDSIPAEAAKVCEILDQLLSYHQEELEGDRVIDILRERLKIKPIELQELNLPDFPDLPKIDLSPTISRKLKFSCITNMYPKGGPHSLFYNIASPSTQKSPFASFPSLARQISCLSPSNNPDLADDIDLEPITCRSFEQLDKEFTDTTQKAVTESSLPKVDKNTEIPGTSASKVNESLDVGSSASHLPGPDDLDNNTDNEFTRSRLSNDPVSADGIDSEPIAGRSFEQLNKEFTDATQKAVTESPLPKVDKNTEIPGTSMSKLNESLEVGSSAACLPGPDVFDTSTDNEFAYSSPSKDPVLADDIDSEPVTCQLHKEFSDATQKLVTESSLPKVDKNTEIPGTSTCKLNESLDAGSSASYLAGPDHSDIIMNNEFAKDKPVAQTNEAAVNNEIRVEDEPHDSDVLAQPSLITEDVALNRDSEEHVEVNQEQSNTSLDKKGKAKSPSRKVKRQKTQRRQSLAVPGIGTTWDDGVRRSTRIRVRPLEHWKGERLLFGRIHNSLPTVIGLKYIPPGESSDNPVLQVKSYVGDEYKELVDVAGLH